MIVLNVPEMSCGHCVATIEAAVRSIDAGAEIQADLPSRTVRVETTAEGRAVREALAAAGYETEAL